MTKRRICREVSIGKYKIGGNHPVLVQSMLNIPAEDIPGNVRQAVELERTGCQVIRASVPDRDAVRLIDALKQAVDIPVVADIHFDYRLAIEAAAAGADKIRINPGNIGGMDRVRAVADACKNKGIPIRIGVNSGSVETQFLERFGGPTPEALCESALYHASLLEQCDFVDIVLSMKSSRVSDTVQAYRLAAERCDYPLHLGVTEAGTERMGVVKSSVGIGALLLDGIGDTIRVSLTADPVLEVAAGFDILRAVGRGMPGVEIISCPTCGRTKIDLIGLTEQVQERFGQIKQPLTIAVMGCGVNGPGEAKEADFGIAGGDGEGLLFQKGTIVKKVPQERLLYELEQLIDEWMGGSGG